jgi:cell division protease FtsH
MKLMDGLFNFMFNLMFNLMFSLRGKFIIFATIFIFCFIKYYVINHSNISYKDIVYMAKNALLKSINIDDVNGIATINTFNKTFYISIPTTMNNYGEYLKKYDNNIEIVYNSRYNFKNFLLDIAYLNFIIYFFIQVISIGIKTFEMFFGKHSALEFGFNNLKKSSTSEDSDNNDDSNSPFESTLFGNIDKGFYDISTGTDINFDNIIGLDTVKKTLTEFTKFIKYREFYMSIGAKIPRGILFVGSPGTAKTMMARAFASECDATFISTCGSYFDGIIVGLGAKKIKKLFSIARKKSPTVIFIDEIDSLGSRDNTLMTNDSSSTSTINSFLHEMDGFNKNDNLIVIATTNRIKSIDKALLRSGRFDQKLTFDLPNIEDRKKIFDMYLKKIKLSKEFYNTYDENIKILSKMTSSLSGADIANIVNLGLLNCTKKMTSCEMSGEMINLSNKQMYNDVLNELKETEFKLNKKTKLFKNKNKNKIEINRLFVNNKENDFEGVKLNDLLSSIDEIIVGSEQRDKTMTSEEKKYVAYHEAGHVLLSYIIKGSRPPIKVSIVPRGSTALGFTMGELEDRKLFKKSELMAQIFTLLAGRASEEIFFDESTTGASDDFEKAQHIVKMYLSKFAFSGFYNMFNESDNSKKDIDIECAKILHQSMNNVNGIIVNNKKYLIEIAEFLLEKEEMTSDDIENIIPITLKNSINTKLHYF